MRCEKCLHREVCDQSSREIWSGIMGEIECSDFMDESKYVEIVRGKWIKEKQPKNLVRCSNCKKLFFDECDSIATYNYCPNCGAKMDGGKE